MSKIIHLCRYDIPPIRMINNVISLRGGILRSPKFTTCGTFVHHCRFKSSEKKNTTDSSQLSKVKSTEIGAPTSYEQIKETTKTASYLGVIVIGVGVTLVLFYQIFQELFSSKSPNTVYTRALETCSCDPRVLNALGEPIKGFGEETRRGRRRHVSHVYYEREGVNYLRMKFYIKGSRKQATVHLEMKENDKGKFEYRYLFVEVDGFPPQTIIIEDNRYDKQYDIDITKQELTMT